MLNAQCKGLVCGGGFSRRVVDEVHRELDSENPGEQETVYHPRPWQHAPGEMNLPMGARITPEGGGAARRHGLQGAWRESICPKEVGADAF